MLPNKCLTLNTAVSWKIFFYLHKRDRWCNFDIFELILSRFRKCWHRNGTSCLQIKITFIYFSFVITMKRTFNLLFMLVYYTSYVVCRPDNRHRHDMPLNVPKLESLGRPETLIQSLKDIAQQSHNCGVKDIPKLRRHFLKNSTITCNDGTSAG